MKIIGLVFLFFVFFGAPSAFAGRAVNPRNGQTLTCEQAVSYYESFKRLYVIANGKDLVPIYGMKPVSAFGTTRCKGRQKSRLSYWAETLDHERCVFAIFCG